MSAENLLADPASDPSVNSVDTARPSTLYWAVGLGLLSFILVINLWVGDDAFITLRVIENFIHGYGLVWNVGERVQVFTHPLWLFLLTPFAFFIPDPMSVFWVPSIVLSLGTIFVLLKTFANSPRRMILAVTALGSSAAFIDYSSSGLENPLTHFLIVLFLILFLRREQSPSVGRLCLLSFIAGLAALNRLDTILLYAPAILYQVFLLRQKRLRTILAVVAGFLPLLLWEGFATFYYGFPLPNTFYTKAQTGLETGYLLKQGWVYVQNSFHWDPLTLGVVLLSSLSVAVYRSLKRAAVLGGILLYLLYTLWIGGDFMSGRFFSGIFLMALVILLTTDTNRVFGQVSVSMFLPTLAMILLIGLSAERPPILALAQQESEQPQDLSGIVNEKSFYYFYTGWVNYAFTKELHPLAYLGMEAGRAKVSPVEMSTIGMYGYYAGRDIYIIDVHALADPLCARLPVDDPFRVGHYLRSIPAGYVATIKSDFTENLIEDPNLRLYYEKLSILIRGDLYAPGRIQEIIRFNSGYYDHLIQQYSDAKLASSK